MAWVETESLSFTARHESRDADAAAAMLDDLERFRAELEPLFDEVPAPVSVVIHARGSALALATPGVIAGQLLSARAGKRYLAGWFSTDTIHVLAPDALAQRASNVPGSREALALTPLHEYVHLVVGANAPWLPPPFTPSRLRRFLSLAWLCEGAAAHFSGQVPHLRAALVRRFREGPRAQFPPSARDALLLGGTVYDLVARECGGEACAELALAPSSEDALRLLERILGRPAVAVEAGWREHVARLASS